MPQFPTGSIDTDLGAKAANMRSTAARSNGRFPTYSSKGELTTQQPLFLSPKNADSEIMGKVVEGIGQIADRALKLSNAFSTIRGNVGKANVETGMADLLSRADTEKDYTKLKDYLSEANTIAIKSKKGLTGNLIENDASLDIDHEADLARIKLQHIFKLKQIGAGQEAMKRRLDVIVQNPGPDSAEKIKSILLDNFNNDIIGNDDRYDLEKKYIKQASWMDFRNISRQDRDLAKQMIEKSAFGFDEKDTDTALSILDHYKSLEDKNTLMTKIDNRFNLIDSIANGKENIYELSPQAQDIVDSDEVLSAAVNKARQSKKGYLTETEAAEEYVKVFQEAAEATDRDALSSLATSLIYRDKNVTPDKLGLVLFYASQRAKNLNLTEKELSPIGSETTPEQIHALQMDAGVNRIARWAKEWDVDVKTHSDTIADFVTSIKAGSKPLDAVNEALRNANLRMRPEMVSYPQGGQLLVDPKGRFAVAYPDGTIKSVATPMKKAQEKPKENTKERTAVAWESI